MTYYKMIKETSENTVLYC